MTKKEKAIIREVYALLLHLINQDNARVFARYSKHIEKYPERYSAEDLRDHYCDDQVKLNVALQLREARLKK